MRVIIGRGLECLWGLLALAAGCGGGSPLVAAMPASSAAGSAMPVSSGPAVPQPLESRPGSAALFAEPESLTPRRWLVLGPLPHANGKPASQPVDQDFLTSVGGEEKARFEANTRVTVESAQIAVREVELDAQATLDLKRLYQKDTDSRVAYAYAAWSVPKETRCVALFGSDDGAAVWLNGQRVHRVDKNRALNPESDQFPLTLVAGTNRLLVKVDNAFGGWGFALRVLDERGQKQLETVQIRRHLEALGPIPIAKDYRLGVVFPTLDWRMGGAAQAVFGTQPVRARWYGPDLAPVDRPKADGQYTALIEAKTLDDFTYRQALTFAKVPADALPSVSAPPWIEMPSIELAGYRELNSAQRTELSRYFWHGAQEALDRGQAGALAALSFQRLRARTSAPDAPSWLDSGFIQAAEHVLRLRLKLDGREPRAPKPPESLASPAPELRRGTETAAGMLPGTTQKLRAVAREWAKADPQPFVVLVARRGVVFLHEGFNGFQHDSLFQPASIGKSVAGLLFARAVDQGLLAYDQPVGAVLPEWKHPHTARVTFRHCFNHVTGLTGHASHGGLFNAYLDSALLSQDAIFARPGTHRIYNGDGFNLALLALTLVTGQPVWRQHYEHLQKPFGENVTQFDGGFGSAFSAMFLGKLGQMLLQDGQYGRYRFYSPGFLATTLPKPVIESAPELDDREVEEGIGIEWMPDPPGPRKQGVLGPNVIGHGAASGSVWRVDPDHQLVIVVGRNGFKDGESNGQWTTRFVKAVAEGLSDTAR